MCHGAGSVFCSTYSRQARCLTIKYIDLRNNETPPGPDGVGILTPAPHTVFLSTPLTGFHSRCFEEDSIMTFGLHIH